MINKVIKYSFSLLALMLTLAACQEKLVNTFEDESSLFFFRGSSNSKGVPQVDSISYSFFLAESSATEDTVWVDVRLTGLPVNTDRPIPIVQTNDGQPGAAAAGIHYIAFDDPEVASMMVMPANKVSVALPVVVKRTAEMNTAEFRLDMAITTNDFFVEGIKGRTVYTVKITAMAVKPALWDVANSYLSIFGPWGQEKMKFIIDYVEFSDFDQVLTTDYRVYLALKAKAKLAEYEQAHGPLYEADGITRVTFP
jgi:hypothetical protein